MVDIRSVPERRRRAASLLGDLLAEIGPAARDRLGALEGEAFLARFEHAHLDVVEPLDLLYGHRTDLGGLVRGLVGVVLDAAAARPWSLRVLDRRREVDPGWFQRSRMVGYACYADRFAGTLAGVRERLDYLDELGVTYLHLMPLLAPRQGENDGGYAVADYEAVDPRLGTMTDLEALADDLHGRGIALCVDLVLNHTAKEHPWARRAAGGDPAYRDFYLVFPDRTTPDAYERTLPEVFPDIAPGNFTHVPQLGGWVWTTFNAYQWDLNYNNPDVFRAMLRTMLDLANRGVDVLRLDAVPFLWKRLGTNCQNQPEVHLLVQAFRALTRVAAPGLVFKAEAIVAPEMLVQYLGAHDRYRPECDLAYNNQLMVMLWSSLASRDARLATRSLARLRPAPPSTGWVTYLRCHDDIGWAVSDVDAAAVGWNAYAHRRFLNDFFSGRHPGSFARGALFQENPLTGDARISGTAAALCGIEAAAAGGSAEELDAAVRRLELLYSVVFSFGGIPLVWMGDELALPNDARWADDPAHAADNRWMHRPAMQWKAAGRRSDPGTVEGRVFSRIRRLAEARRSQLALRAGGETDMLFPDDPHVLAYRRRHQRSAPLLALANFSDQWQSVDAGLLPAAGLPEPEHVHSSRGRLDFGDGRLHLPPWGYAWLTNR
ncbi:MAG TPA: amylosucrase [Mycobacteriales bacterium]|nr:amylosucrase [Mycobacteriales bacterium]